MNSEESKAGLHELANTILESIVDPILAVDAQWRFTFVNIRALHFFEQTIDDLLGKSFWQFRPPGIGAEQETQLRRAMAGRVAVLFANADPSQTPYTCCKAHPTSDGGLTLLYQEHCAIAQEPTSGNELCNGVEQLPIAASLVKRAQLALEASEERFRLIASATNDGLLDVDLVTGATWCNETYETLFGPHVPDSSDPKRCWRDRIHPDDRQRVLQSIDEALKGLQDRWVLEYRLRGADGSYAVVFDRTRIARNEASEPVRTISSLLDLTGRREAEERASRQLKQLVDANIIGLVVGNEQAVLDANDLYLMMIGHSREELIGGQIDWVRLTPPDSYEKDLAGIQELRRTGICSPFEKEYVRRDGVSVPVLIGAAALPGYAQLTWVAFVIDLSEQKQLQRSLVLANEQLSRANQDLEQFAYSVSHDLREPLRTLTAFSNLLSKEIGGQVQGEALELLSYIEQASRRMGTLVRDLLTYLRVTRREEPAATASGALDSLHTNAAEALQSALDNLAGAIRETNAHVAHGALPFVAIRPFHLQQLFQNLIGNAVKYRRPGVSPVVDVQATQDSDRFWRFSVRDNGIGIAAEYKDGVFGLFQRVHRDDSSGTGVGLALCQSIIELYGGRIWIESELGQGSTFHFLLPA